MTSAEFKDRLDALVSAMDRGDHEAVADRTVIFEQTDPPDPPSLLADLRTALEDDNPDRTQVLLNTLIRRYDQDEAAEGTKIARSKAAIEQLPPDGDLTRIANSHVRQSGHAHLARAEVYTVVQGYLSLPPEHRDDADQREAVHAVERLVDYERSYKSVEARAVEVADTVALPPTFAVLGMSLEPRRLTVGDFGTLTVTIGNVGDEVARDITITGDATDHVSLMQPERTLNRLSAGEEMADEISVTTSSTGEATITVEGTTRNAGAGIEELAFRVFEPKAGSGLPDWLLLAGGLGALGLGGAAYRRLRSKEPVHREDQLGGEQERVRNDEGDHSKEM